MDFVANSGCRLIKEFSQWWKSIWPFDSKQQGKAEKRAGWTAASLMSFCCWDSPGYCKAANILWQANFVSQLLFQQPQTIPFHQADILCRSYYINIFFHVQQFYFSCSGYNTGATNEIRVIQNYRSKATAQSQQDRQGNVDSIILQPSWLRFIPRILWL